ncbi:MAG: serine--tRNA ligase, partial [Candidatus Aenigmarchaeota archaeon]|nr:serine--tRNA ligase [Candidatus Aenigmarchaeota archaeon]
MIDIKILRENPQILKENMQKRHRPLEQIEQLGDLDKRRREILQETEALRSEKNIITKKISELKSQNKPITAEMQKVRDLPEKIKELEKELVEVEESSKALLLRLPNILHESVPAGRDESENKEVYKFGSMPAFDFTAKDHQDLGIALDMIDIERAAKLAGSRFYFLKSDLALLEMSIMRFAIDHLAKKGYMLTIPPHMIRREPYEGVVSLDDFENVLYKIEDEDLYMIATSEHPLTAQFMKETIEEHKLPIKLAGFSSCYRKEAGTHGKDMKGIFRVHQFNKVEQVVLCRPDDSWKLHEEMLENVKEIHKQLELPFHVILLCSGDTGTVSAKTYDLEAWLPAQQKYRELASCSNCTDYQSRRLQIKYGIKDQPAKGFVYTLNSTAAVDRALVAIMENNQTEDGSILVPRVLQPYMGKK